MQNNNFSKYFDEYDELRAAASGEDRWLKYLTETGHVYVNAERMNSVEHVSSRETIMYVMRTLDVLDEIFSRLEELPGKQTAYFILSMVLKWSEVAKGGNKSDQATFRRQAF